MLLTQEKAKEQMRAQTNLSIDETAKRVKKLARYPDGKRMKVHPKDLSEAIQAIVSPKKRGEKKQGYFSVRITERIARAARLAEHMRGAV